MLWVSSEGEQLIEASAVKAVDSTGAGDAFIGCFSHTWVKTGNIAESLRLANIYAGDSVTRCGTQTSYATASEFEETTGEKV